MRLAALLPLVALVGCKSLPDVCDDYPSRTCIALQINLSAGGPSAIDTVVITPLSGLTLTSSPSQLSLPKGSDTPLPILVAILPATLTGSSISVGVSGLLSGQVVGDAAFSGQIRAGDHQRVSVDLAHPGPPDMAAPPDMVTIPPCDPVAQSYCPAGDKCTIVSLSSNATTCVHDGTVNTANLCTLSPDNCRRGGGCYSPISGVSWCMAFCNSAADCPGSVNPLSPSNTAHCCTSSSECPSWASTFKAGPVTACSIPCSPVIGAGLSGCPTGSKCDVFSLTTGGTEFTTCYILGTGTDGVSCTKDADCAAGYGCFNHAGGMFSCRPYCRKGNNADCTIGGETCVNVGSWSFIGACCPAAGC